MSSPFVTRQTKQQGGWLKPPPSDVSQFRDRAQSFNAFSSADPLGGGGSRTTQPFVNSNFLAAKPRGSQSHHTKEDVIEPLRGSGGGGDAFLNKAQMKEVIWSGLLHEQLRNGANNEQQKLQRKNDFEAMTRRQLIGTAHLQDNIVKHSLNDISERNPFKVLATPAKRNPPPFQDQRSIQSATAAAAVSKRQHTNKTQQTGVGDMDSSHLPKVFQQKLQADNLHRKQSLTIDSQEDFAYTDKSNSNNNSRPIQQRSTVPSSNKRFSFKDESVPATIQEYYSSPHSQKSGNARYSASFIDPGIRQRRAVSGYKDSTNKKISTLLDTLDRAKDNPAKHGTPLKTLNENFLVQLDDSPIKEHAQSRGIGGSVSGGGGSMIKKNNQIFQKQQPQELTEQSKRSNQIKAANPDGDGDDNLSII